MFDFLFVKHFETLRDFAAVGFVAWLTWLVARHGVTWVWTKAQSAWSSLVGDFSGLSARITALETDVGAIKAVVPAPVKAVASVPVPPPVPAVTTPAPAVKTA